MKLRRYLLPLALVSAALLVGCASGVTRMDSPTSQPAAGAAAVAPHVKAVQFRLSDEAKKLVADNLLFNLDSLKSTVERALSAQNLLKSDSQQALDIEITGFRARSNFSAIMFGFMAGNDNVEGIVTVKDSAGNTLKRGKVSASYALGGIGGGQNDARMGWLYEEFAKHTVSELTGARAK